MPKPKECPKCKSEKIMRIMYGLIEFPKGIPDDVLLGGCCVTGHDPYWHCGDCHWEWGSKAEGRYNVLEKKGEEEIKK